MTELFRLDHTDDPISIEIRRHMKGQFLAALDAASKNSPLDDNLRIVIYGSTLMRELVEHQKAELPFAGVKSSDIDIGAYAPNGNSLNPSEEEYIKGVCPMLRQAIFDAGYSTKRANDRIGSKFKITENAEVINLGLESFVDDYYVTRTFTAAEIKQILAPKWKELEPYFKIDQPIEINLSISSHQKHFPLIMRPIPMYSRTDTATDSDENPALSSLCRADRYDMLAGKIARSFTAHFKPTDLIDIYNLYHGTVKGGNKPILELGQEGQRDHRNVLRLLVLHYLMMSNAVLPDLESSSLLETFKLSEKNKKHFEDTIREQVSAHKQQDILNAMPAIFETSSKLLQTIFPEGKDGKKRVGPLHLKSEEVDYVLRYYGRARPEPKQASSETGISAASSWLLKWLGGESSLKPVHDAAKNQRENSGIFSNARYLRGSGGVLDCEMDLTIIRPLYQDVERMYPRIFPNLQRHDLLHGLMKERQFGKEDREMT